MQHPDRRSLRLPHYDYTEAGAYFVTICAWQREHLFGEIVGGVMQLNTFGQIAHNEWLRTPIVRPEITLDEWVIMPNHLHGIIVINDVPTDDHVGAHGRAPLPDIHPQNSASMLYRPPRSLGSLIAGYKSIATKRINAMRGTPRHPVWQRNYYEHIVRSEHAIAAIRCYIIDNPARWHLDRLNAAATGRDPHADELRRVLHENDP